MKTILITGGTGKIGKQLVSYFLKENWQVIITTRSKKKAKKLFELNLKESENLFHAIEVDLMDKNSSSMIKNKLRSKSLYPDVLVNNARNLSYLKVNNEGLSDRELIMKEYTLQVIVPYELSVALVNMSNSALESIINISSIYGVVPFNPHLYEDDYPKSAPIQYSLSKSAVIHLSKELAIRFRKKCRVNTISYGGVEGRVDDKFKKRYANLCPEEEMLSEGQTIGPVSFLASEKSKGITGQNIIQDGGWTIW